MQSNIVRDILREFGLTVDEIREEVIRQLSGPKSARRRARVQTETITAKPEEKPERFYNREEVKEIIKTVLRLDEADLGYDADKLVGIAMYLLDN